MADITVTAADIRLASDSVVKKVQFGAAATAGQVVYLDTSDNKYKLGDANASTTTAGADGLAIAYGPADSDGYGVIITGGSYDCGATVTEGDTLWLSATPGGMTITPADLVSGWNISVIGVAGASNVVKLILNASGHTVP